MKERQGYLFPEYTQANGGALEIWTIYLNHTEYLSTSFAYIKN